jgi:HEAT repeat protein
MPHAALAYYRISGELEEPLKVLVATMKNPTYEMDSIDIIGKIGPNAKAALPEIIDRLDSTEPAVREAAVIALGRMATEAQSSISKLEKIALNDEDLLIRGHAAKSLKLIRGE